MWVAGSPGVTGQSAQPLPTAATAHVQGCHWNAPLGRVRWPAKDGAGGAGVSAAAAALGLEAAAPRVCDSLWGFGDSC